MDDKLRAIDRPIPFKAEGGLGPLKGDLLLKGKLSTPLGNVGLKFDFGKLAKVIKDTK